MKLLYRVVIKNKDRLGTYAEIDGMQYEELEALMAILKKHGNKTTVYAYEAEEDGEE